MRFLTVLGAWCVVFPIKLVTVIFVATVAIIELPAKVWSRLDEILDEIHSNEGN